VDGKIVSFEPYRSSNIGRKIYYWTMALHMGVFGGVAGQLVMLLIAAVILLIVTTGATTFLQRRANAKRNAAA
jgi:sulfite reductase (NADPH) flavoprotein alpha-component